MYQVPAEIVLERPTMTCASWTWAVCQPDAHWGEWAHGKAATFEQARRDAQSALFEIEYKKGRGLI